MYFACKLGVGSYIDIYYDKSHRVDDVYKFNNSVYTIYIIYWYTIIYYIYIKLLMRIK